MKATILNSLGGQTATRSRAAVRVYGEIVGRVDGARPSVTGGVINLSICGRIARAADHVATVSAEWLGRPAAKRPLISA